MGAKLQKIQGAGLLWGGPLLAAFIAIVVYFHPGAADFFQYDRERIAAGEIWRLLSSHWTHWSLEHLFWDAIVFVALLRGAFRLHPGKAVAVLGVSSLAITLGIYWLHPGMIYYRGLSGLDAALTVFVAVQSLQTMERKDGWDRFLVPGVLVGLGGKILFEALTGRTIFVAEMAPNVTVVPLVHIIGAGIGFAASLKLPGKMPRKTIQTTPCTAEQAEALHTQAGHNMSDVARHIVYDDFASASATASSLRSSAPFAAELQNSILFILSPYGC